MLDFTKCTLEISGYCIPQTNVNDPAYRLYLKIDQERKIIPGALNCSCSFGAGGNFAYQKLNIVAAWIVENLVLNERVVSNPIWILETSNSK